MAETPSLQRTMTTSDRSAEEVSLDSQPAIKLDMPNEQHRCSIERPASQANERQQATNKTMKKGDQEQHDASSSNPDGEDKSLSDRISRARKAAEARVPAPTDDDFFIPFRIRYIRRPRQRFVRPPPIRHPLLVLKPINLRPPPCLRCAVHKMTCSFERLKGADAADGIPACARCIRNGEPYCIKQLPERVEDGVLKAPGPPAPADLPPDVAEAVQELLRGKLHNVCGVALSPDVCKALVLPKWHDNDKSENRQDPDYEPRTWDKQLYERKVEILVKLRKKMGDAALQEGMAEN